MSIYKEWLMQINYLSTRSLCWAKNIMKTHQETQKSTAGLTFCLLQSYNFVCYRTLENVRMLNFCYLVKFYPHT